MPSRGRRGKSLSCCSRHAADELPSHHRTGKGYDDLEEDDEDSEEEERQREEALKKGDPYQLAEEEDDPWELYR
jgi:hypothetical protein